MSASRNLCYNDRMEPIVIIDHGAGNLRSVQKALEYVGHDALITNDPGRLASAPGLVFPGQGSSPSSMAKLKETGMDEAICDAIKRGRPFFGICLGFQLLLEWSDEGDTECLGVLPGRVKRLPSQVKVPHMGWNQVHLMADHPVFTDIPQDSLFYFAHTYYADPDADDSILGTTDYGGKFCSAIAKNNLIATQFHPEKSGPLGLRLYDNFIRLLVFPHREDEL